MSLKIWLPLTGTLDNKGASSASIALSGATVNSSGKLGNCYSFDGNDDYISITDPDLYTVFSGVDQPFSVAMWVYHADSTRAVLFGDYQLSGSVNLNFELYADHNVRFYWGANPDYNTTVYVGASTWTHIALTYDGSALYSYTNGVLTNTRSGALVAKDKTSGAFYLGRDSRTGTTALNGKLNDFRIYDHCLSAAEVHEIAKGLVLHYKLDDIVNPNLLTGDVNTVAAWTLDGTTCVADSGALKVTVTSSSGNQRIYHAVSNVWKPVNSTYTVSFEARSATEGLIIDASRSNITGSDMASFALSTSWKHYKGTIVNSAAVDSGTLSIRCTTNGGVYWIKNVKLERGTLDTGFVYSDYVHATVHDSSGYGHHGTITGTLSLKSPSPRYEAETHFSATSQYIKCGAITTTGFADSYSFSWWGLCDKWASVMQWGFNDGIRVNGIFNGIFWNTGDGANNPLYSPGTTTQVTAPTTGEWHHFVMTGDGTSCKVYKDGVHWATAKTYKSISGTQIYINGWNADTSYKYDNLSMSDFRVYATALSADDIRELYEVEAKVVKTNSIHTYEFVEDDVSETITNSGQIIGHGIYETLDVNLLQYDKLIYTEPDGSKWIHVFHHDNPVSGWFRDTSVSTWKTGEFVSADIWFDVCRWIELVPKYELMIKQKTTSSASEVKYRWIQNVSPLIAVYDDVTADKVTRITSSGYTDGGYGGLYIKNYKTYMSIADYDSGNWFGAIGCWTGSSTEGIPGYPLTVISTGYMDLYLRIYPNTKFIKNIGFSANHIIEM